MEGKVITGNYVQIALTFQQLFVGYLNNTFSQIGLGFGEQSKSKLFVMCFSEPKMTVLK